MFYQHSPRHQHHPIRHQHASSLFLRYWNIFLEYHDDKGKLDNRISCPHSLPQSAKDCHILDRSASYYFTLCSKLFLNIAGSCWNVDYQICYPMGCTAKKISTAGWMVSESNLKWQVRRLFADVERNLVKDVVIHLMRRGEQRASLFSHFSYWIGLD